MANKTSFCKGRIPWNKGKTNIFSSNTLLLIANAAKGNKNCVGRKVSEETINSMRKAQNKNKIKYSKPIIQCDIGMNMINTWESTQEAAKALSLNGSNISACLHGRQRTAGGFIWVYKNREEEAA